MNRLGIVFLFFAVSTAYAEHTAPKDSGAGGAPKAAAFPFPCIDDIAASGNPALRLIEPSGAPDRESTLVGELLKKASAKELALSFQGDRARMKLPEGALVSNFDDNFIPALHEAARSYANFVRGRAARLGPKLVEVRVTMLEALQQNDFLAEAWKTAARDGLTEKGKRLAEHLDAIQADRLDSAKWAGKLRALRTSDSFFDDVAWTECLKAIADSSGALAKAVREKRGLANLDTYFALVESPLDEEKDEPFFQKVVVDQGVRRAAAAIGKLYCDNLKDARETHVVISPLYADKLIKTLYPPVKSKGGADGFDFLRARVGGRDLRFRDGKVAR